MHLPIQSSISQIDDNRWLIGQEHLCELVHSSLPKDAIAQWSDTAGRSFCIRKARFTASSMPCPPFYTAGDSAALWQFAGKIWKVKAAAPNMQMEGETIAFVTARFPNIPVPGVVCHWMDSLCSKSFLVLERAAGQTLDSAWASLAVSQRNMIASTIAGYVQELATVRSTRLETVSGLGLADEIIQPRTAGSPGAPSLLQLSSLEQAREYFHPLEIEEEFVFSHGDLNPGNIMVDSLGRVTCFLDWELAGFVPRWWIHFKAHLFAMQLSDARYTKDWKTALVQELEARGIVGDVQACLEWLAIRDP